MPADLMVQSDTPEELLHHEYASLLKNSLEYAYSRVRDQMGTKLEHQKQLYDRKVHGKPYEVGDMVWLHSQVVPRGTSKKLFHLWSGPHKVVKRLSDITYCIVNKRSKRQRLVVHFDRLKPYGSQNKAEDSSTTSTRMDPQPGASQPEQTQTRGRVFGEQLDLVDPDEPSPQKHWPATVEPPRYPCRSRSFATNFCLNPGQILRRRRVM